MKTAVSAALLIALFGAGAASIAAEPVSAKGIAIQGNQLKATRGYVLDRTSRSWPDPRAGLG